jgi:hypothetical protein
VASIGPSRRIVLFSKFDGGSLPERAMAALAVVEDFDVVEDLGAQLDLRRPRAAMDELLLQGREEALGDGVIEAVALAAHRLRDARLAGRLPNASDTNWLPWSGSG